MAAATIYAQIAQAQVAALSLSLGTCWEGEEDFSGHSWPRATIDEGENDPTVDVCRGELTHQGNDVSLVGEDQTQRPLPAPHLW